MKPQKYRDVVAVLRAQGWVLLRTAKSSHEVWGLPDGSARTVVPHHRQVSAGVVRQIAAHLTQGPDEWL